jgi:hypothetical protein
MLDPGNTGGDLRHCHLDSANNVISTLGRDLPSPLFNALVGNASPLEMTCQEIVDLKIPVEYHIEIKSIRESHAIVEHNCRN